MNAETAVGAWQSEDWRLEPQAQAHALPKEARQLADVLTSSDLDSIKKSCDLFDRDAVKAQIEYKTCGRRAVYLYSAAAIFGALVLYASTQATPSSLIAAIGTKVRLPLLIMQALALGGASYYAYLLRENAPFERWMSNRAAAEMERRRFFEWIVSAPAGAKQSQDEIDLMPLQLEYFRRYHLDTQLNYFLERAGHHETAARRFVTGGALLALISTIAVALGGLVTDLGEWIAPLALIGVSAPVLVAANGNLKLLSQDRRNALRYRTAAQNLSQKQRAMSDVRRKVQAADAGALRAFVQEVNDIISLENSEWLAAASKEGQRPQFAAPGGAAPQPASKPN